MSDRLTVAEIHERFPSEWILLGDPESDERLGVLRGTLLCHSKDRQEIVRKAIELPAPKNVAVLFTGNIPEGTAILL